MKIRSVILALELIRIIYEKEGVTIEELLNELNEIKKFKQNDNELKKYIKKLLKPPIDYGLIEIENEKYKFTERAYECIQESYSFDEVISIVLSIKQGDLFALFPFIEEEPEKEIPQIHMFNLTNISTLSSLRENEPIGLLKFINVLMEMIEIEKSFDYTDYVKSINEIDKLNVDFEIDKKDILNRLGEFKFFALEVGVKINNEMDEIASSSNFLVKINATKLMFLSKKYNINPYALFNFLLFKEIIKLFYIKNFQCKEKFNQMFSMLKALSIMPKEQVKDVLYYLSFGNEKEKICSVLYSPISQTHLNETIVTKVLSLNKLHYWKMRNLDNFIELMVNKKYEKVIDELFNEAYKYTKI